MKAQRAFTRGRPVATNDPSSLDIRVAFDGTLMSNPA